MSSRGLESPSPGRSRILPDSPTSGLHCLYPKNTPRATPGPLKETESGLARSLSTDHVPVFQHASSLSALVLDPPWLAPPRTDLCWVTRKVSLQGRVADANSSPPGSCYRWHLLLMDLCRTPAGHKPRLSVSTDSPRRRPGEATTRPFVSQAAKWK